MSRTQTLAARVDLASARSLWCAKQGLAPRLQGGLMDVVCRTGWVRTLGGIDVYLAVRARWPSMRRSDLDRAVQEGALRVVPAARGCMYLVPESQVPLALDLAASLSRPRTDRELAKVGVTWSEIDDLGKAVFEIVKRGPMTTAALRKALPEGAVRSLGAAGKKIGMSSPLPVALRELEFQGRIERTLEDGRLDTERYLWRAVTPSKAAGKSASASKAGKVAGQDPAARNARVARYFFEIAGPAPLEQFAAWSGLSRRDARAALAEIPVLPVAVDSFSDEAWVLEEDLDALRGAAAPDLCFALLPFEDNVITLHGGPGVHVSASHHDHPVDSWGSSKPTTLGQARHVGRRSVLCGDALIGFWEYDLARGEVVYATLDPVPRKLHKALREECASMARFLRDDLGHCRSFSLDTDEAVQKRADAIRVAAR